MALVNVWENRIRLMLSQMELNNSQRKYLNSVMDCIEMNRDAFPTMAQRRIVSNIWRHCQRLEAEAKQMELVEAEERV